MRYCTFLFLILITTSCGQPQPICASTQSEFISTPSNFGYITIKEPDGTQRKCSALVKGKGFYSVSIFTANHCFRSYNLIDAEIQLHVNEQIIPLPKTDIQIQVDEIISELSKTEHPEPDAFRKALIAPYSRLNQYILKETDSCYQTESKDYLCTTSEDLISFTIQTTNLWVNQFQNEALLFLWEMERMRNILPLVTLKQSADNCTKSGNKGKFCPFYQEIKHKFKLEDVQGTFGEWFDDYYVIFKKFTEKSNVATRIYLNNESGFDLYEISDLMEKVETHPTSTAWKTFSHFIPGDSGSVLIDDYGVPIQTISTLGNDELSDGFAMSEIPPPRDRKLDKRPKELKNCD